MRIHEVLTEELDYVSAVCLDPSVPLRWQEIMEPCMKERKKWLKAMMAKGLRVLVALDKPEAVAESLGLEVGKVKAKAKVVHGNVAVGLIEYVPIEFACEPVEGKAGLFINCIWVIPPFWHRGVARMLLENCLEKARAYGGGSVLAYKGDKWFGFFPYMPTSFFEKFGFREVGRERTRVLMYLDLGGNVKPKLIKARSVKVEKSDKLVVDEEVWCVVNAINTDDRKIIEKYGLSRGICINDVPVLKRMASLKEVELIVKQTMKR